jgi:hypothetical protein
VELLDHHVLFEGARGREVVQVILGDLAIISELAGKVWDGAVVGIVCFLLAEVAWGTGSLECCMERQILFYRR